jgi:lysophospholipase L1-like esterase
MQAARGGISRRGGLALLAAAAATPAFAQTRRGAPAWSTVWTATLQRQANAPTPVGGRTVRIATRASAGGSEVRVRLSNEFGAKPLHIGAASVILKGRAVPLTFSGAPSTVVPSGAPVLTDAVKLPVAALDMLDVALFLPDETLAETFQRGAGAKGMIVSDPGDFTRQAAALTGTEALPAFVSAIEVLAPARPNLVIFGDTKSAGPGTWPDFLPPLTGGRMGVANRSQYAGLMALGAAGESGLARFDRDVLSATGATHVLIFNGNNDLIQPGAVGSGGRPLLDPALTQTAEQLIAAQAQAALRARAAGLKTIGGTWLPYEGVAIVGYATPEKAAKRMAVNAWMRKSPLFDLVIDFEAALQDPAHPGGLLPAYDSGNHFTPSEAGYKRMAEAAWAKLKTLL